MWPSAVLPGLDRLDSHPYLVAKPTTHAGDRGSIFGLVNLDRRLGGVRSRKWTGT
jgi:hypothetical protein